MSLIIKYDIGLSVKLFFLILKRKQILLKTGTKLKLI